MAELPEAHHTPEALIVHAGHNGREPTLLFEPSHRSPIDALGGAFDSYADLISLDIEENYPHHLQALYRLCQEETPQLNRLPPKWPAVWGETILVPAEAAESTRTVGRMNGGAAVGFVLVVLAVIGTIARRGNRCTNRLS